jgi:Flp pilus assembly pilin Flp
MKNKRTFQQSIKGQGLIEYLVLVCLITVSSIAVVSVVGANIKELYANVAHSIQGKRKIEFSDVEKPMYQSRSLEDFTEGAHLRNGGKK